MSRRRLDLFNLLDHNNQTKYVYMIQNTLKASRECNYSMQSAQQILISLMINSCTDSDMIKFLTDNAEEIATMEYLHDFKNLIKMHDVKFTGSPAYLNYTVLGTKAVVKIGKVGTSGGNKRQGGGLKLDENEEPPKLMLKTPCFRCAIMGHTFHNCPNTQIIGCKVEGCKKDYNPAAHTNFKEHVAKGKAKGGKKVGVKVVTTEETAKNTTAQDPQPQL